MFSFRTTPISEQLDKALVDGKVAVFCNQSSWNPVTGDYLYDVFRKRGNLAAIFCPSESELDISESHIDFDADLLGNVTAVVVEIQDVGSRYFNFTIDVFRLMSAMNNMENAPALYVVDHVNPAGRTVEGTMPSVGRDVWTPMIAHRHGLTLGELCNLYHNEIGAAYPLHVISAEANPSTNMLMPWTVAPSADVPGLFTAKMYSGGALWLGTSITPGIGTPRPYEYIGAPFIKPVAGEGLPAPSNVIMRPCSFTPSSGLYEGEKCFGYQIVLLPGEEYHSLLHTVRLLRHFIERYSEFTLSDSFFARLADPVIETYLKGGITFDIVQEHVKTEEQKWIRKAKRFVLYDESPCRIK